MKFDVVLIEREDLFSKQDAIDALSAFPDEKEKLIPVGVEGEHSCTMGFIRYDAADRLNFMTDKGSDFYSFIKEILDDMDKENPLCLYTYTETVHGGPVKILLTRDLPAALARLNQPAIGFYCLSNTAAILVHEIDNGGEYVVASINGAEMQECKITEREENTGFAYGGMWVPLSEVMRI